MADDALSRAKKALNAPKGNAVVPAGKSGRDLIERAKAAAQRPLPAAPVNETKSAASLPALVERARAAAARPVPERPKPPEPAKVEAPVSVPVEAPASVPVPVPPPAAQVVPVEIAPGQTVPVELPQNAAAGGQPIVVNVNVVNEQRGWGPYWPYPYWHYCRAWNCPRARGLPCTGWFCRW